MLAREAVFERWNGPLDAYYEDVPEHEKFYAICQNLPGGAAIVTVVHEVPADAKALGAFPTPGEAIDFAQQEVRRLNAIGVSASYVDPDDDLVGTG